MMKKFCLIFILTFLVISLFGWQQNNNIPSPLKVLYPFSVELKFEKPYNLIKAQLATPENLVKYDEEEWRATLTDSLKLTLMALKPGQIEVPEIQVINFDELGSDTLYTKAFTVEVIAVTDSTSQLTDIKPIQGSKDPILLESQFGWIYSLLKYLIIFIFIALILWFIYKYWDNIKKWLIRNKLAEADNIQLPWEFAFTELNNIKRRMLLINGKEYFFSIEMSLVIRRFLEKYYDFPAAERTTSELKKELNNMQVNQSVKLIAILQTLDQVKYTKGKVVTNLNPDHVFTWFESYVAQIKESEEKKAQASEAK